MVVPSRRATENEGEGCPGAKLEGPPRLAGSEPEVRGMRMRRSAMCAGAMMMFAHTLFGSDCAELEENRMFWSPDLGNRIAELPAFFSDLCLHGELFCTELAVSPFSAGACADRNEWEETISSAEDARLGRPDVGRHLGGRLRARHVEDRATCDTP